MKSRNERKHNKEFQQKKEQPSTHSRMARTKEALTNIGDFMVITAGLAILPLMLSLESMFSHYRMTGGYGILINIFGFCSLPITLPLTVITLAVGSVVEAGALIYATVMVPANIIRDLIEQYQKPVGSQTADAVSVDKETVAATSGNTQDSSYGTICSALKITPESHTNSPPYSEPELYLLATEQPTNVTDINSDENKIDEDPITSHIGQKLGS